MRPLALVSLALLTAGCGVPDRPLSMGFKEVPSDVVLGEQTPDPAAPTAEDRPTVFPVPPSVVTLPPPPFDSPPRAIPRPPPPPLCPVADPLQAPAAEAPNSIDGPPADGLYLFRNEGTYEVSGAGARRGSFPATSQRRVTTTSRSDDGRVFEFTVAETLTGIRTTTTYRVVRTPDLAAAAEGPPEAGIYIRRVESRQADGQVAVFAPTPELRLAALPLVRGARIETRGVDPTTATSMSFTSTVAGKARVDACGEPLDSFTLELSEGRVLAPRQDLQFAATYAVGTQFGGLVLRDTVAFAGTDGDAGISRKNTSTISEVPRRGPGAP